MKYALALLVCTGCEGILGLGETKYTGGDGGRDARPPDACTGSACQSFASCRALQMAMPNAASGVVALDAGTGAFNAYCEQSADGGGWTLALKVDGSAQTFNYDDPIWENTTLLAADAPDLDHTEAKLETWNAVPFSEVRVVFEYPINSTDTHSLVIPLAGAKLFDLFQQSKPTTLGRDAWKSLMGASASLQLECNLEGTNIYDANIRVRLGIISNNEADCLTPDSRIGVGGGGPSCVSPSESAGDTACYEPDNGEVELAAFAWVFVR